MALTKEQLGLALSGVALAACLVGAALATMPSLTWARTRYAKGGLLALSALACLAAVVMVLDGNGWSFVVIIAIFLVCLWLVTSKIKEPGPPA